MLLFAMLIATVLLPMVGLAIDGAITYFAQSRLVSATDAAALAGGRSLNVGLEFSTQKPNAEEVARKYFAANFPPGILNSKNVTVTPDAEQASNNTLTVTVNSSADIGLYFLNILGFNSTHLTATAKTSRKDINIVLALDRSGSMAGVCTTMRDDAANFAQKFINGRDTMGLVTFMGNAHTDYDSTKYFLSQGPSIVDTLKTLKCGNNTGSAAAISLATQQLQSVGEPGAQSIIVFFTDGEPNGFTSGGPTTLPGGSTGFPVKSTSCNGGNPIAGYVAEGGVYSPTAVAINSTSVSSVSVPGCLTTIQSMANLAKIFIGIPELDAFGNSASATGYSSVARDGSGNITFTNANSDAVSRNAADDAAAKARQAGIFIYTVGLDGDGGFDAVLLQRIANDPSSNHYNSSQPAGKYYYSPNAGQLASIFNSIASEILRIAQ